MRTLAAEVVPVGATQVLLNIFFMRILRVVGLGLAIVMLRFLLPRVFHGLENTLVAFFDVLKSGLALASQGLGTINLPK